MKNSKNTKHNKKQKHFNVFALLIIAVLGIIIYSNSFDCSFHFDDYDHIVDNPAIHDIHDVDSWRNYSKFRPISTMTFVLNYHFHELDVYYYHLVNLSIHIINGFLVYFFVILLLSLPVTEPYKISTIKEKIAAIVALFFVAHPLATQSVTYIIQRQAAMASLFYLLALCIYLYVRIKNPKLYLKIVGYLLVFLSFIIAALSKENAYTLPVIIVMTELFLFKKEKFLSIFKNYKTYIVLVILIISGILVFSQFSPSIFNPIDPTESYSSTVLITPWNYLLTQFSVILKYIQLFIFPLNQNLDYDYRIAQSFFEFRTIISFLILCLIVGYGIYIYNRNRLVSYGIFWFFITLSIESSFIPLADVIFEHRTYLPSVGFFIAFVSGIYYLLYDKNRKVFYVLMIIPLLIFSFLTYQRNLIWKTDFSLWNDVVQKSPNKSRAYANRGLAYNRSGQLDLAFNDYTKAIELDSSFSIAWMNRGLIYVNRNQLDKAISDFSTAIDINTNLKLARWNRGVIYSTQQNWNDAIVDYNKIIEIDPDFVDAHYNRGVALANLGDWQNALSDFENTIKLKPDYPNGAFNCAVANDNLKNYDQAVNYYSQAIKLNPGNINAYYGRAVVLMNQEKWQEAYDDFILVSQNAPDYPGLQQNINYVVFNMEGNTSQ